MMFSQIRKLFFSSDVNISCFLSKKAILFENVKRAYCRVDTILQYFHWKGVYINKDDIHIMTNILTRPTGRIMVLVENLKKENFDFDFYVEKEEKEEKEEENADDDYDNGDNDDNDKSINESSTGNINGDNKKKESTNKENANKIIEDDNNNRSLIKTESTSCFDLRNIFSNCKIHLCDDYEIERFVEECERFLRFTEDIKRVSKFENLNKIVTIINVPSCYGRKQLYNIIYENTKVKVQLNNIIFSFKKNGTQRDCAYILCDTIKDANIIIHKIQELPVAKKYHLKEFYGASFLYASRNNLFISNEHLDYLLNFSKYKIFTCGWHKDITIKEFENFLITLKIFPCKIIKILYERNAKAEETNINNGNFLTTEKENPNHISVIIKESENSDDIEKNEHLKEINEQTETTENSVSFILFFENMRMTKKVFTKLERLKRKWKISPNNNFYAYPKMTDLHFDDDENYADEDDYEDSDLDEEIEY